MVPQLVVARGQLHRAAPRRHLRRPHLRQLRRRVPRPRRRLRHRPLGRPVRAGRRAVRGAHHQAPRRVPAVGQRCAQSAPRPVDCRARLHRRARHRRARQGDALRRLLLGRARLDLRAAAHRQPDGDDPEDSHQQRVRRVRHGPPARADRPVRARRAVERHRLADDRRPERHLRLLLRPGAPRCGERPVEHPRCASRHAARRLLDARVQHQGRRRPQVGGVPGHRQVVRLQPDGDRGDDAHGRRPGVDAGRHRRSRRQPAAERRPHCRRCHPPRPGGSPHRPRLVATGERRGHLRHPAVGAPQRHHGRRARRALHPGRSRAGVRHRAGRAGARSAPA